MFAPNVFATKELASDVFVSKMLAPKVLVSNAPFSKQFDWLGFSCFVYA